MTGARLDAILMWLGLMFVYLKLTHQIDWHWAAVLAPLYGPTLIMVVCAAGSVWLGRNKSE
jgi:hypothetical protein